MMAVLISLFCWRTPDGGFADKETQVTSSQSPGEHNPPGAWYQAGEVRAVFLVFFVVICLIVDMAEGRVHTDAG